MEGRVLEEACGVPEPEGCLSSLAFPATLQGARGKGKEQGMEEQGWQSLERKHEGDTDGGRKRRLG